MVVLLDTEGGKEIMEYRFITVYAIFKIDTMAETDRQVPNASKSSEAGLHPSFALVRFLCTEHFKAKENSVETRNV